MVPLSASPSGQRRWLEVSSARVGLTTALTQVHLLSSKPARDRPLAAFIKYGLDHCYKSRLGRPGGFHNDQRSLSNHLPSSNHPHRHLHHDASHHHHHHRDAPASVAILAQANLVSLSLSLSFRGLVGFNSVIFITMKMLFWFSFVV